MKTGTWLMVGTSEMKSSLHITSHLYFKLLVCTLGVKALRLEGRERKRERYSNFVFEPFLLPSPSLFSPESSIRVICASLPVVRSCPFRLAHSTMWYQTHCYSTRITFDNGLASTKAQMYIPNHLPTISPPCNALSNTSTLFRVALTRHFETRVLTCICNK